MDLNELADTNEVQVPQSLEERKKDLIKIFTLLFLMMFVARTDQGIVPALNTTLRQEFGFNEVELGELGSVVYIGAVVGK